MIEEKSVKDNAFEVERAEAEKLWNKGNYYRYKCIWITARIRPKNQLDTYAILCSYASYPFLSSEGGLIMMWRIEDP